jgi:hypothetical protein
VRTVSRPQWRSRARTVAERGASSSQPTWPTRPTGPVRANVRSPPSAVANIRAVARVTPNASGGATSEARASAGGVTVAARATVDPRSGRATAQGGASEQAPPTRQIEQEKPNQHVDVLSVDILAPLELPDGPIALGQELPIEPPAGAIRLVAGDPEPCGAASCGHLRMVVSAESAPVTQAATARGPDPAATDDDFGSMFAEVDAMLGPPKGGPPAGMGLGGFGARSAGLGLRGGGAVDPMAAAPTMTVDADVTALVDAKAGRTHTVEGRGAFSTRTMGMTMSEATRLTLTFFRVR